MGRRDHQGTADVAGGGPASTFADRSQLKKKVSRKLDDNLIEGEEIAAIIRGRAGSVLVATNRRAFVFKLSTGGGLPRLETAAWEYAAITGAAFSKGAMSGTVVLQGSGLADVANTKDALDAPNAIVIDRPYGDVEQRMAEIRRRIAAARTPMVVPSTPSAGGVAGELERLAALRASGALTDDEFEAAKAAALGR